MTSGPSDLVESWHRRARRRAEEGAGFGTGPPHDDPVVQLQSRTADVRWVPPARNISGDLLFVDHRSHHAGEIGEISFGDPEYRPLWPRMDLMLADLCEALEKGIPVTSVPRIPRLYEGRMLEWPVR